MTVSEVAVVGSALFEAAGVELLVTAGEGELDGAALVAEEEPQAASSNAASTISAAATTPRRVVQPTVMTPPVVAIWDGPGILLALPSSVSR
jgi:hypothetical protein